MGYGPILLAPPRNRNDSNTNVTIGQSQLLGKKKAQILQIFNSSILKILKSSIL